ncbi:MAG: diphosphomevalonate decarboxylase [Candidatus Diapherotrites archaeon]|nr:diphosphomevalonate decarboxylase [Candidatus Diapherotrites archaeon]
MKATANANANIALVKYWGKRNEKLILPHNSSISVTLDGLKTTTTAEFSKNFHKDEFTLNGERKSGEEAKKVSAHLTLIRKMFRRKEFCRVESQNNFPSSAGLASSSSAFAALTLASISALGFNPKPKELSIIARQGSGSASRSIFGGFAEWKKGVQVGGGDSYAVQLYPKEHWPEFRVLACIVSEEEKKVKSRAGMKQTVETSPFYRAWLATVEEDLKKTRRAIKEKNIGLLGKTAELNCLKMQATMITTAPSIVYWEEGTLKAMHAVWQLREEGVNAFFTMDAGPQVKITCLEKDLQKIKQRMNSEGFGKIIESRPGDGTVLSTKHLF